MQPQELVGQLAIRTKSTKRGMAGYQTEPIFICKVTNDHMVAVTFGVHNILYDYRTVTNEEIKLAAKTGVLRTSIYDKEWIDDAWISFQELMAF